MITFDHGDNIRERNQAIGDSSLFSICGDEKLKELSP